jgi:hypothetical protein
MLQRGKNLMRVPPSGNAVALQQRSKAQSRRYGRMEKHLPVMPIPAPIPATADNRSSVQAAGA